MKKICYVVLAAALLAAMSLAQDSGGPQNKAEASQAPGSPAQAPSQARLAPGITLRAELDKSIDAKKAKVGDPVVAKTMDDLLSGTEVVAPKGSKIFGHIVEVTPHQGDSPSTLGIAFDKLMLRNGTEVPLIATIQAIGKPESNYASGDEPLGGYGGPAPASGGRGGMSPGMGRSTGGAYPGSGTAGASMPGGASGMSGSGQLSADAKGVVGMSGLSLSTGAAQDSVISSQKHNVKLDSGTQMILRTQ